MLCKDSENEACPLFGRFSTLHILRVGGASKGRRVDAMTQFELCWDASIGAPVNATPDAMRREKV
eukprot:565802-Amphidinium_carterae.1